MAGSQAELDALRKTEETTAKRLAGFQRRSGKLANRLQSNGDGDGRSKPPRSRRPSRCPGVQRRLLSAQTRRLSARRRRSAPHVRPAAWGSGDRGSRKQPETVSRRLRGRRRGVATPERPKKKAKRPRETADATGGRRTTKAEGTRRFESAPAELVWDILDQPDRIAQLIPAVESIDIKDESHWTAKVKVPLKRGAPLLLECEKSDQRRPDHGRLGCAARAAGLS